VLDSIGARDLGFGDDLPYRAEAWEAVARGERPTGDDVAEGFFHLARIEERAGGRDRHGRFPAFASCLDPLDPPLERLRRRLAVRPPRWGGASFAVALTHDVDLPWRWTPRGVRASGSALKSAARQRRPGAAIAEARSLASVPFHKLRGSDPYWSFERITRAEAARGVRSTFYVMAGHAHPADGPAPRAYERLRPKLVGTILAGGAEVGLHGSYTSAEDPERLRAEKARLEELAGPIHGQRYHYLRVDPHRNLAPLVDAGFAYDTSLGFADAPGFRAGIAHPFRPWDLDNDRPLDLVEIPLAAMDVTLGEERYLGLSSDEAGSRLETLLDWASVHGGGFALLWHSEWFDGHPHRGWDVLYLRLIDAVRERGGICVSAGELAEEAAAWLR
jgi:peptidoglycan/xylan/chitin deacetylase (PgdA/CDA1 family)